MMKHVEVNSPEGQKLSEMVRAAAPDLAEILLRGVAGKRLADFMVKVSGTRTPAGGYVHTAIELVALAELVVQFPEYDLGRPPEGCIIVLVQANNLMMSCALRVPPAVGYIQNRPA